MPNRDSESDALDRRLRAGLEPSPEASQRVARQALDAAPSRSHISPRRWAALAAATLTAVILVAIWSRGPDTPAAKRAPIQITNHGELVATIDPAGGAWLHAPANVVDAAKPRLIITIGEPNAN